MLFPASSPPASWPHCRFVFLRSRVCFPLLSTSPHGLRLAVRYGYPPRSRLAPFIQQDSDHAGHTGADHRFVWSARSVIELWSITEDGFRTGFRLMPSCLSLGAWRAPFHHLNRISCRRRIQAALKGRTGRTANRTLGRTGMPFWQDESYDHWIRNSEELKDSIDYVENNPVKAGLVECKQCWPWSSARAAHGHSAARQTTKGDRLPHAGSPEM